MDFAERLKTFTLHIENAMKMVLEHEESRPGSMVFTKLEEAMLWANVLLSQIPLKQIMGDEKPEVITPEIPVHNSSNDQEIKIA